MAWYDLAIEIPCAPLLFLGIVIVIESGNNLLSVRTCDTAIACYCHCVIVVQFVASGNMNSFSKEQHPGQLKCTLQLSLSLSRSLSMQKHI